MNAKVALFVPSLAAGGAERVMVRLANMATQLGIAVDLLVCRAEGVLLPQLSPNVNLIDLRSPGVIASLPALVRYLRAEKPHGILSAMAHANVVAVWSRYLAREPCRVIVREANTLGAVYRVTRNTKEKATIWLARAFYGWANSIVAPSQGVAEDLVRLRVAPPQKVQVIYNPVVTEELFQKAREEPEHEWLQDKKEPVILAVGRLTPQKDFGTLIRAFAAVRRCLPAKLVILGEGEERAHLQHLLGQLGLEEDVSLPGVLPNPAAFMSRADLFVLSSRWEGMPNALVEAVALGVPAVSTDCPSGPREVLDGGRLGKLVPVGDVQKMAEAILETLSHPPKVDVTSVHERFGALPVTKAYLRLLGAAG